MSKSLLTSHSNGPIKSVLILGLFLWLPLGSSVSFGQSKSTFPFKKMETAQKLAQNDGKKVVVDFYASWCGYCKKMVDETYTSDVVGKTMNTYYHFVRVDIESDETLVFNGKSSSMKELAASFGVRSTPTYLFVDSDGKVIGAQPGFMPPPMFGLILSFVGSDAYKSQKFDDFSKGKL